MDTTNERPATPNQDEQTDRVAAGMLGLDLKEFGAMTHLAKSYYRNLAHNLLQIATVTAR